MSTVASTAGAVGDTSLPTALGERDRRFWRRLPPQTRKAANTKGLITEIRTGLQTALGVDAVELAELDRISIPKLLTWVGFVVLANWVSARSMRRARADQRRRRPGHRLGGDAAVPD